MSKEALVSIFLMISFSVNGQDSINSNHPFIFRGPAKDIQFIVGGNSISKQLLLLKENGDIYYKPSSFCDCRKCRKFKGMKLLKRNK